MNHFARILSKVHFHAQTVNFAHVNSAKRKFISHNRTTISGLLMEVK